MAILNYKPAIYLTLKEKEVLDDVLGVIYAAHEYSDEEVGQIMSDIFSASSCFTKNTYNGDVITVVIE